MFGELDAGTPGAACHVLSNLFWRNRRANRGDDNLTIRTVVHEAKSIRLGSPAGRKWRMSRMRYFLRPKRDEGIELNIQRMDNESLDQQPSDAALFG